MALRVILNQNYVSYQDALNLTGLKTLKERRTELSLKFAKKCTGKEETMGMFPLNNAAQKTRNYQNYKVTSARTSRLAKSAIPSMQRQLNNQ